MKQRREEFRESVKEGPSSRELRTGVSIVGVYTFLWFFSLPFFVLKHPDPTTYQKIIGIVIALLTALVPPGIFYLFIRRRYPEMARGVGGLTGFAAFCLIALVLLNPFFFFPNPHTVTSYQKTIVFLVAILGAFGLSGILYLWLRGSTATEEKTARKVAGAVAASLIVLIFLNSSLLLNVPA